MDKFSGSEDGSAATVAGPGVSPPRGSPASPQEEVLGERRQRAARPASQEAAPAFPGADSADGELWQDWDALEEEPSAETLPAVRRIVAVAPVELRPPDPDSLGQWIALYYRVHVAGASPRTERAKRRDLELFAGFFLEALGHDRVDGWTPAITRAFLSELRTTRSSQSGRPYKPATVNRVLATVRHFSRWLHKTRPFLAGPPFAGVKALALEAPAWNGLISREVLRLRAACEQRLKACTRRDQNPLLEVAVFHVLLHTGLRESELCSLDLEQYHHRGFHQVPRKGKAVTAKVPVPGEARTWLDTYLEERRGLAPGPLFRNRRGRRVQPQDVARICQRLCRQANAHVPREEHIHLTPHMLRHTFLKKVADKHGVHVAQRMSGNVSISEIFRYTKPSDDEIQQTAEDLFT